MLFVRRIVLAVLALIVFPSAALAFGFIDTGSGVPRFGDPKTPDKIEKTLARLNNKKPGPPPKPDVAEWLGRDSKISKGAAKKNIRAFNDWVGECKRYWSNRPETFVGQSLQLAERNCPRRRTEDFFAGVTHYSFVTLDLRSTSWRARIAAVNRAIKDGTHPDMIMQIADAATRAEMKRLDPSIKLWSPERRRVD